MFPAARRSSPGRSVALQVVSVHGKGGHDFALQMFDKTKLDRVFENAEPIGIVAALLAAIEVAMTATRRPTKSAISRRCASIEYDEEVISNVKNC
jgi:hypothetical protein